MGDQIQLRSKDGLSVSAYLAQPAGPAKGGVVVLQEIFGVNAHIRAVADGYAAQGFFAVAPATFDRVQPGVNLGYAAADMEAGFALKQQVDALPEPGVMQDIQAAIDYAAQAGKVGIVGYCWGGLLSWRSACLLSGLSAAVTYYGGGMTSPEEASRRPKVSVLSHFGDQDHWITLPSVQAFRQARQEVEVHIYQADHGFNCDHRGAYNADAAAIARQRTLAFFEKYLTTKK